MRRLWLTTWLWLALCGAALAQMGQVAVVTEHIGSSPPLTVSCPGTGATSSTIACTLTYTGTAPSSATGAWNTTCPGSSTITGFTASGGSGSFTASTPSSACVGTLTITTNLSTVATSGSVTISVAYTGDGDIITYGTWYSCARAYNAAYAAAGSAACNLRRGSDATASDFNVLTNGKFDAVGANTFAGVHATCTSASASGSTTLAFVGCSATPSANDFVSGTVASGSVVQPLGIVSCGTFFGGAGNCTMLTSMTVSMTSVSVQWNLLVSKFYDETGHGITVQVQSGAYAPWFPDCGSGLPCSWATGAQQYQSPIVTAAGPSGSFTAVEECFGSCSATGSVIIGVEVANSILQHATSANLLGMYNGSLATFSATDNAVHTINSVFGSSGFAYVDNSLTASLNSGTSSGTGTVLFSYYGGPSNFWTGPIYETGYSNTSFTSGGGGTALQTHANQCAFYGTPC